MSAASTPKQGLVLLLLIWGVFCGSTAIIMIKAGEMHPVLLAALRLLFAAAFLTPLYLRRMRAHPTYHWKDIRHSVLPGLVLGIHFISWITGGRLTIAANASLIVNMVPIAMPFFLYGMLKEPLNRGEITGTVLAISGVLLLCGGDFHLRREYFVGDMVCFGSMLFFTWYLTLARYNRAIDDIWLYVVPLYYSGGLFCLLVSLFTAYPYKHVDTFNILIALGLALIPTVMGHSSLNFAMQHLRGQIVSIVNLCQFIMAGLLAYFFYDEIPAPLFYLACGLILTGAIIAIRALPSTTSSAGTK